MSYISESPDYNPQLEGQIWVRQADLRQFKYTDITDRVFEEDRPSYDGYDEESGKVFEYIPVDHIREETQGATGAEGLRGITGRRGVVGIDGNQGQQGATGATGPIGATGPDGDQGLLGRFGERGLSICEPLDAVPTDEFVEQRGAIFMTKPGANNRIFIATGI